MLRRGIPLEPAPLAAFITRRPSGELLAAATRNRRLSLVRGFLGYLRRHRLLRGNPLRDVRRARLPRTPRVALSALDIAAVVKALLAESPSWRRTREATILMCFFYTGLRLTELTRLDLDQVDLGAGVLRRALRKGGDITDVVLHPCVAAQLAIWVAARPAASDGSLFPRGNTPERLSGRMVQKRLRALGQAAGLGMSLHPHLLRHAHATGLLRAGVSVAIIQESMNHRALATTERYLHGDLGLVREAVGRLPAVPLVPPVD